VNEINDMLEMLKEQAQTYIENILKTCNLDLSGSAKEFKAIERIGETSDAKVLLLVLVIYATSGVSLRIIAVVGCLCSAVNVTDEAWRQRFLKCGAWVFFLLQNSLSSLAPTSLAFCHNGQSMQVYLIDATMFKQEGKTGSELRVHMCYNLTKGAMEEVVVSDKHTAESAKTFTIKPGSLYIADAGYGKGVHLECIVSQNGYALFRVTPNQIKLATDSNGKNSITLAKLFKTKKKLLDFHCFIHTKNKQYMPVRIIASRLPEDKALLAREHKIRTSRRRQSLIREATLIFCEWVVLMTNVDSSHSAQSLLDLYRSRWQIEMLFKRIKQFFSVKRLKKATLEHSKLLITLWMFIWSAIEKEALEAEIRLIMRGEDISRYSPWVMTMLTFKQFETIVNAVWALSYNLNLHLHDIYRLLRNHKSRRLNQYALSPASLLQSHILA